MTALVGQSNQTYSAGLVRNIYTNGYFAGNVNWFNSFSPTNTVFPATVLDFGSFNTVRSEQLLGYWYAPTTDVYTFTLFNTDAGYLWLGRTALTGFTTGNALVNNGGIHNLNSVQGSISLVAGNYYPMRIQWGYAATGFYLGNFEMYWENSTQPTTLTVTNRVFRRGSGFL